MRRRRATVTLIAVVFAVGFAAVVANEQASSPKASDTPPANAISAFSRPAATPSGADAALVGKFKTVLSRPAAESHQVDVTRIRTFKLGDSTSFEIVAAPQANGGICYEDTLSGVACFDNFSAAAGVSFTKGVIFGLDHWVASGLVPDGVSQVSLQTANDTYRALVVDNVFRLDLPANVTPNDMSSYSLVASSGQTTTQTFIAPGQMTPSSATPSATGGP
jgi:hypothetical protein